IGERIGQSDEVFFFGDHVLGHAAVALPSVSAAILGAGAGDHVAATAIVANAAAGDVVDDDAIAGLEAAAPRTFRDNLAAGFVAGNNALISFRAFSEVLVINAADVGAADGRSFDPQQNFAMSGSGHRYITHFDGRITGQVGGSHGVLHCLSPLIHSV